METEGEKGQLSASAQRGAGGGAGVSKAAGYREQGPDFWVGGVVFIFFFF